VVAVYNVPSVVQSCSLTKISSMMYSTLLPCISSTQRSVSSTVSMLYRQVAVNVSVYQVIIYKVAQVFSIAHDHVVVAELSQVYVLRSVYKNPGNVLSTSLMYSTLISCISSIQRSVGSTVSMLYRHDAVNVWYT
jgi:hypothetical protein